MKKVFNHTLLLGLLCVILFAVNAYFYMSRDKSAPVITFPDGQLHYTDDTKRSDLLEGVTASDDVDGDVTDSLRVYNIAVMEDGESVAITYYAKDSSNNVASSTRIAVYDAPGINESTETKTDENNESGSIFVINVDDNENNDIDQNKNPSSSASDNDTSSEEATEAASDKPVIILSRESVTVGYRSSFSSLSYIQDIKDDKDSYEYLFRRIVLESDVSTKRRGSYTADMYVVDSDGNKSDTVTLRVTVE